MLSTRGWRLHAHDCGSAVSHLVDARGPIARADAGLAPDGDGGRKLQLQDRVPVQLRRRTRRETCEGNRIISIEKGHYNDVDLAGVQLLVTFQMRTWSKIYISDKVGIGR